MLTTVKLLLPKFQEDRNASSMLLPKFQEDKKGSASPNMPN